jgi:hypothetical protein
MATHVGTMAAWAAVLCCCAALSPASALADPIGAPAGDAADERIRSAFEVTATETAVRPSEPFLGTPGFQVIAPAFAPAPDRSVPPRLKPLQKDLRRAAQRLKPSSAQTGQARVNKLVRNEFMSRQVSRETSKPAEAGAPPELPAALRPTRPAIGK